MTSNQLKAILDKQESEATRHGGLGHDLDLLSKTGQLFDPDHEESGCSYLDQEAKIPFRKLKQVRS